MKILFQLSFIASLWAHFSSVNCSECNFKTYIWVKQRCTTNSFQNHSLFFQSFGECYPWIVKFPRCWKSYQDFVQVHNRTDIAWKCRKECLEFYNDCTMLKELNLKNGCVRMDYWRRYCSTLKKKDSCKSKEITKSPVHPSCSGPITDEEEASRWVLNWTHKNGNFKNITKGCSLTCDSQYRIHRSGRKNVDYPIILFCSIGMAASLFTVLSFLIDWKAQNRYPAVILFILNLCFLFCLFGWMLQFFGLGSNISCNSRRGRRIKEPVSLDSFWCIICFVLIYFSVIAIGCWFVVLNYAWFISFKTMGPIRVVIQDKVKYFHVLSWGIPCLFTLLALWMQQVDAHPITDICFVFSRDPTSRDGLVILPSTLSIILGEILLVQCVRQLKKLRVDCSLFLIPKAVKNITRTMYRLVFYGCGMLLAFILLTYAVYKEKYTKDGWNEKNSKFVKCKLQSLSFNSSLHCEPPDKSPILYMHLQLLSFCIMCCMTSSWTWTRGTMRIWKKVWKKHFTNDPSRNVLRAQISWYNRMHKKKVSPFIPPVNSINPLEENNFNFIRHDGKRLSLPDELLRQNKRNSSADIRSVVDLFSKRRNTFGSLQSIKSSDLISEMLSPALLNPIRKSSSIQSFGHISITREIVRTTPSNLTVVQVHNYYDVTPLTKRRHTDYTREADNRFTDKRHSDSRLIEKRRETVDEIQKIRDKLYTPLTTVHKDNIVADCVPYNRNYVDDSLVSSVIELRKNIRSGRESVDAIDKVLNITSRL